jgi:hypothetical protein
MFFAAPGRVGELFYGGVWNLGTGGVSDSEALIYLFRPGGGWEEEEEGVVVEKATDGISD